jgi:acetyl esterase/lipase
MATARKMRPSLQSKILACILKAIHFRKLVEKRASKQIPGSQKSFVPHSIKRTYLLKIQTIHAKEIATFERKEKVTKNHVIFFHGGAYIFEAAPNHWKLAEKIVKKSFCRMTLIDYPLAPGHDYKETFRMVSGAYELLISQYTGDNFILMGDSAGGGLALAFAQKLIMEKRKTLPAKLVLLSPWLDLSMSNPNIKNLERSDYILTVNMLRHAGMKYANGENQDHHLLSPIHGELKDLPETIVFYGTEELFYADCIKFKSMVGSDKQGIIFKEYRNMQHDWAIFPIPERTQVVHEICEFIKEK